MNKIFMEYKLKGRTIKNRIVMPPMVCFGWADNNGIVTENHYQHYKKRAIDGAGLIVFESLCVVPNGRTSTSQLGIWSDIHIEGLRRIVEVCHENDVVVIAQIHHAGLKTIKAVSNDITAPSDYIDENISARALTIEEIANIKNSFVEAAIRAQKAGFDGVELHGAHGFLLNQFVSPLVNKRVDEYGGDFSRRMKFSCEIIKDIKAKTNDDYIIGYRMGGNEPDLSDGIKVALALQKAGVDILHVSAGIAGNSLPVPDEGFPFNWIVYCGTEINKKVDIPVIVVNGIKTPEQAEFIVNNGLADFVAVGKGILADPEWVSKAYNNHSIIPCKDCPRCLWFKDGKLCPARL